MPINFGNPTVGDVIKSSSLFRFLWKDCLKNGDFNAIVVHWGGGALTSYNQAYVNARLDGLETAYLVNTLVKGA